MKLSVQGIDYSYNSKKVLNDVSFEVTKKESIALLGPNGSGKTTLLKCLNKNLEPKKGTIYLEKNLIESLSKQKIAKEVSYLPQQNNKEFPTTVFSVVLRGRKPRSSWRPTKKDREKTTQTIRELGLEELANKKINELSGGQLRKVALARAINQEPEIMLLDEPTSSLDLKNKKKVLETIQEIKNKDVSIIASMHELSLVNRYFDKIILLKDGEIKETGGTSLLTEENIREVYDIDVRVIENNGDRAILPKNKPR